MTCVRDCQFAYGSYALHGPDGSVAHGGSVIDLRDPTPPEGGRRLDRQRRAPLGQRARRGRDRTWPGADGLGPDAAPRHRREHRRPEGRRARRPSRPALHGVEWPRGGRDRFAFVGRRVERHRELRAVGGGHELRRGARATYGDVRAARQLPAQERDRHRWQPGRERGAGMLAALVPAAPRLRGRRDHRDGLLRPRRCGSCAWTARVRSRRSGASVADGAQASAAYWITDDVVYVVDYVRGLDIVRFKEPARARPGATGPGQPAPAASSTPPSAPADNGLPRVARRRPHGCRGRALRDGVRVRLRCSRACRAVLELTDARGRRVAGRVVRLDRAGRRVLRLRLPEQRCGARCAAGAASSGSRCARPSSPAARGGFSSAPCGSPVRRGEQR